MQTELIQNQLIYDTENHTWAKHMRKFIFLFLQRGKIFSTINRIRSEQSGIKFTKISAIKRKISR